MMWEGCGSSCNLTSEKYNMASLVYSIFQVWVSSESRSFSFRHLSDPRAVRQQEKNLFTLKKTQKITWEVSSCSISSTRKLIAFILDYSTASEYSFIRRCQWCGHGAAVGAMLWGCTVSPPSSLPSITTAASFACPQMHTSGYKGSFQIHGECCLPRGFPSELV